MTKRFTVSGTLTKVEWINPHIVVTVDAKGENWRLESNPPSWFRRVGVNRSDFAKAVGQTVTVETVRAKDGTWFRGDYRVIFLDGTTLTLTKNDREKLDSQLLLGFICLSWSIMFRLRLSCFSGAPTWSWSADRARLWS